ncbi:hypothetical protein EYZ11_011564 [Aspergillus tanneri]|uniref:Uncharacterized protein n=1 Tax=Aspergillus tanneri TaxID=1220188 RepID=A0A4S3J4M5_9EURO|nr:hypothetical protein EYZ11_011564 [Aspergillus tanneri]
MSEDRSNFGYGARARHGSMAAYDWGSTVESMDLR